MRAWRQARSHDDPLEALESGGIGGEGVAGSTGRGDFDIFYYDEAVGALPEHGFDAAHAAEAPFVVNEGVDEEGLAGIGGAVVCVVTGGQLGEILGFFIEHNPVNGEDAVLEGVETGYGFALDAARAGVFLSISAISGDLFSGCHKNLDLRLAGVFGAGGSGGAQVP